MLVGNLNENGIGSIPKSYWTTIFGNFYFFSPKVSELAFHEIFINAD